ncbi:hypothetical protein J6590_100432 [Homalodisca vitripennis]|nr:hypothetical protein J6590_100432 [Homalodisca vitripennis]
MFHGPHTLTNMLKVTLITFSTSTERLNGENETTDGATASMAKKVEGQSQKSAYYGEDSPRNPLGLSSLLRPHYGQPSNTKLVLHKTIVRPILTYAAPTRYSHTSKTTRKFYRTGHSANRRTHHGSSAKPSSYGLQGSQPCMISSDATPGEGHISSGS